MKKYTIFASICIVIIMLFSLASCSEDKTGEQRTEDGTDSVVEEEDNLITANYDKQEEWSFIRGDLMSEVISSHIEEGKEISADLFNDGNNALIMFDDFACEEMPLNCGVPIIFWNKIRTKVDAFEDLSDESMEYYFAEDKIHLQEGCIMQVALADLDMDGTAEIIVAVHDGVIDGALSVIKAKKYSENEEGKRIMEIDVENLGTAWFQNEIVVGKNGHLICSYGSQGLYTEYGLIDGKLQEIETTVEE